MVLSVVDCCASVMIEVSLVSSIIVVVEMFSVIGKSFVVVVGSFVVDIVVVDPSVFVLGGAVLFYECITIYVCISALLIRRQ